MNSQTESNSAHNKFKKMIDCYPMTYAPYDTLLSAPNQYFFIKEIAFFTSYEDATAYSGNKTVIDLSCAEAAEKFLKLEGNTSTGLFGQYSFDDKEKALSLEYSTSSGSQADYGSRVKFSLRMKRPGTFSDRQSYMVVTYKTNIIDSISLKLGNFRHKFIVLAPDVSISNGEYVRTDPVDINIFELPLENYFKRLNLEVENYPHTNSDLLCLAPLHDPGSHRHNHMEILYNIDGVADVLIHGKKYELKKGDAVIVNPKLVHKVICNTNTATVYSIRFLPDILYPIGETVTQLRYQIALWQKKLDNDPFIPSEELTENGIDSIITEIIDNFRSQDYAYEVIIHAKITNLFGLMLRKYCAVTTAHDGPTATLMAAFEKAISTAKSNLFEYNTADAARDTNMSYSYFCNNFKKAYGESFSSYLEKMRLHEAEHLLLTPEKSITEIAVETGFSSASHFIKKFKLAYGLTPYAYRTNIGVDQGAK